MCLCVGGVRVSAGGVCVSVPVSVIEAHIPVYTVTHIHTLCDISHNVTHTNYTVACSHALYPHALVYSRTHWVAHCGTHPPLTPLPTSTHIHYAVHIYTHCDTHTMSHTSRVAVPMIKYIRLCLRTQENKTSTHYGARKQIVSYYKMNRERDGHTTTHQLFDIFVATKKTPKKSFT